MSSFELNKVLGAVLLAVLVMVVIGKIGDNLVTTGGGQSDGHGADATMQAKAPAVKGEPAQESAAGTLAPAPAAPKMNITEMLASADPARGKKVFNKCKACHTVNDGGKNGIGPNLWNIVNRATGAVGGFKYSTALAGMSAQPWNYENLNAFLTKPRAYAKGTKMTFAGIRKDSDRAHLIAYLRSLSPNPAPLE